MPVFRTIALATCAALALAGCKVSTSTTTDAVDTARIAEVVKADMARAAAAFNAKDVAGATAIDAEGYVGMFHGQPNVTGKAEDVKVTQMQVADPAGKIALSGETVDVSASGDMAVFRATYSYTYTDPATKKPASEEGNWILGFRKQKDGSMKAEWGVVSDTGKSDGKPS